MKKSSVLLVAMAVATFASGSMAQAQKSWNEILAAAREEGKVVVTGPPNAEVRKALPAAFKARFGITMEYIGGPGGDAASRLRTERNAGAGISVDAMLAGGTTVAPILHREKMIDPIKPVLMLPEVLDTSKWRRGQLSFMDPEQQYILKLADTRTPLLHINTRLVKPEELRSSGDLLDPKWKGKIALMDPTVPGTGNNTAAQLYAQRGEEFVKRFYLDQKPAISRDTRQLTDWLARGTYPIVFGAEDSEAIKLRKEDGLPLLAVQGLSDLPSSVTSGFGLLTLVKDAPHPNAAKVFVNWIASKEGQETFARALGVAPLRSDIDATAFLPAEMIPQAGVTYFDTTDWEYTMATREKVRVLMKAVLGR
jgi:iron(III) transport system substrate-binding protein